MPRPQEIVINTGPILALVAAMDDLKVLQTLYRKVHVPHEVCSEILDHGIQRFAAKQFEEDNWLAKAKQPIEITPMLSNTLDCGEAAVIQYALDNDINTVCIDEIAGRRIARVSGLKVTGSLGVLLLAKKTGVQISMADVVQKMKQKGIRLSESLSEAVIKEAGE